MAAHALLSMITKFDVLNMNSLSRNMCHLTPDLAWQLQMGLANFTVVLFFHLLALADMLNSV